MACSDVQRRDLAILEKRRMQAADLLERGIPQAEVARTVGVQRQSVSRWAKVMQRQGRQGLTQATRAGRKCRLTIDHLKAIDEGLRLGPRELGYATDLWTARRVVHLIEDRCGINYHPQYVTKILHQIGWSLSP